MHKIGSIKSLEKFGRIRLSDHFVMRDFLYSEVGNFYAVPNIPDNPDLAIKAGEMLCQTFLDPLFKTFGNLNVRSSYRSSDLNKFCNEKKLGCASNTSNYASHIWDKHDSHGFLGATACVSVPWFADQYDEGRDWRDLAWWIHDKLPLATLQFFPIRAAFNISWHEQPQPIISSFIKPMGKLFDGIEPEESLQKRRERYADFPVFRGIVYPPVPQLGHPREGGGPVRKT